MKCYRCGNDMVILEWVINIGPTASNIDPIYYKCEHCGLLIKKPR